MKKNMDKIKHFVVVVLENRSFDSLLGHLPHIRPEDGIKDKDISLDYPKGKVKLFKSNTFWDPDPDPGEGWPNVNAQLWNHYTPGNEGKASFPIYPSFMHAPYNIPENAGIPTMDGFALDYYYNYKWQTENQAEYEPTQADMNAIGAVHSPETAPVINTLAQEYAVFTHWFCEVPSCTSPNRQFLLSGTSQGRIDNEYVWNTTLTDTSKTIFDFFENKKLSWNVYYDIKTQIIPSGSFFEGGLHRMDDAADHLKSWEDFIYDAEHDQLPAFSWVEPNMLHSLTDYHPPTDIRAGEEFLASVYATVRNSPGWEETALIICFDEHGGSYDHVPPPHTIKPDDYVCEDQLGFKFDRFGLRVPAIVVSAHTKKGTVIEERFHSCSIFKTLYEHFNLEYPTDPSYKITKRVEIAPNLSPAFNLKEPRTDNPEIKVQRYKPDTGVNERLSQIAAYTLRNVAKYVGYDDGETPKDVPGAKSFLQLYFHDEFGKFCNQYLKTKNALKSEEADNSI